MQVNFTTKNIVFLLFLAVYGNGYSQKFSSLVDTLVPCNCTYKQKPVMLKLLERNHIRYDSIYVLQTLHPSGIRIGTPAITTMGADEHDVRLIVDFIDRAIKNRDNQKVLEQIKKEIYQFMLGLIEKIG